MRRLRSALIVIAALVLAGVGAAIAFAFTGSSGERSTSAQSKVRLVRVASGFDSPIGLASARSQPSRVYIVEQPGRIIVLDHGKRRVFLDVRRLVSCCGEQGLLSIAFDPRYAKNHRFYVDYTDRSGDTRVVRYRSNGRRAIPSTARQLLFVAQPYANHNGGQLAFGPDGRLYVGMGDGGSEGDPQNRSQNLNTLLGKLLRIDVNAAHPQAEIVGYGLRNPWRFSFDRATGDLWIGDVGGSRWEEVDYTPKVSPGLENYGWNVYEGRAIFENKEPSSAGKLVMPIAVYSHADGNCTIIGGFVYRGRNVPALRGRYVYGDWCTGLVWSLRQQNGKVVSHRREPVRVPELTSFGEGASGELYAVSRAGTVYRFAR